MPLIFLKPLKILVDGGSGSIMQCGMQSYKPRPFARMGCGLAISKLMATCGSRLDQSSQELLRKLDEQLKECTPLEESPGEQGHGLDYAVRWDENKRVSYMLVYGHLPYSHVRDSSLGSGDTYEFS